jgi:protein tyrosine phosphatase (PTP) superfamily phosphohydrolase (DUF442 family)
MKVAQSLFLVTLLAVASGCSGTDTSSPKVSLPSPPPERIEAPGLHNVFRLSEKLYSGSSPEGDEGFDSLKSLGVHTIITVDGARPDVERAHQFGMRYVHLPIGYDGVPKEQGLRIAKAVRDLPGSVYLHCHHGQHRGPAAAAVARLCTDPTCQIQAALDSMRSAGTDPHYTGLYAAVQVFQRPAKEELDRVPDVFPEVAEIAALAQAMVGIDERWERLKAARTAGWKTPATHPDIDPPHEALLLAEAFREAARLPQAKDRPEELARWLVQAEENAKKLEMILRAEKGSVDATAAERAFDSGARACTQCHTKYRDAPHPP